MKVLLISQSKVKNTTYLLPYFPYIFPYLLIHACRYCFSIALSIRSEKAFRKTFAKYISLYPLQFPHCPKCIMLFNGQSIITLETIADLRLTDNHYFLMTNASARCPGTRQLYNMHYWNTLFFYFSEILK